MRAIFQLNAIRLIKKEKNYDNHKNKIKILWSVKNDCVIYGRIHVYVDIKSS